jgi:hypothetical protein
VVDVGDDREVADVRLVGHAWKLRVRFRTGGGLVGS